MIMSSPYSGIKFLGSLLSGKILNLETQLANPFFLGVNIGESCSLFRGDSKYRVLEDLIISRAKIKSNEGYFWEPPADLDKSFYQSFSEDWKFVYLIRDPRNRIESILERVNISFPDLNQRESVFEMYLEIEKRYMTSVLQMLNHPQFKLVKVEDLIKNPVETIGQVLSFLDLSPDYQKLQDISILYSSSSHESPFKDNGENSSFRWKVWSKEEREKFFCSCGESLVSLGYEKDETWMQHPGSFLSKNNPIESASIEPLEKLVIPNEESPSSKITKKSNRKKRSKKDK